MSIAHITGIPLTVRGRTIQRCGLCGRLLLDSNEARTMPRSFVIAAAGSEHPAYPPGRFLRCHGDSARLPVQAFLLDVGDELPVDSCYFSPEFHR